MSVIRVYPVANFSRFFEAWVKTREARLPPQQNRAAAFVPGRTLGNRPRPVILNTGASMNSKRSYLDTLNAGRQRRPHTSLEDLNRSLETLEQRLERTRTD
ncbi:MAG: hypothetical protein E5W38_03395, partial [Mesorhizobium sp.]